MFYLVLDSLGWLGTSSNLTWLCLSLLTSSWCYGGSAGSGWQAVDLSASIWFLILQHTGLDSFPWWSQSSKFNKRADFSKQDLFKPQLVLYLLMSHWPKQVKWPTQIQDHGEINLAFCVRTCRISFQWCEYREGKNLAILTVYHREIIEILLMEILKTKETIIFLNIFNVNLLRVYFCFQQWPV